MSMWPTGGVTRNATVACPECGRAFSRRGLPLHRRMRHAPGSPPETVPAAALPTPATDATSPDVLRTLEALALSVSRLDARLDRILEMKEEARPAPPTAVVWDKPTLERELGALLAEIARLRIVDASAEVDGEPSADARTLLGKLRRRQAAVLARLLQLDGDPAADELWYL